MLRWKLNYGIGSLALALAHCLAYGQSPDTVFKSTTTLQSVPVRVIDRNGNDVEGLTAEDFTLLDRGRPQKIAFFGAERVPISLAVLLDTSRSMDYGGKLQRAQALLAPLLTGSNHPDDEIFFVPFTDRIEQFQQMSAGDRLHPPSVKTSSGERGTAFYDALASALCHLRSARNVLQAIVIITDGADQHSRLTLDQLVALTQSSNAQIFAIGLFDNAEYRVFRDESKTVTLLGEREIDNPIAVFERLANESGAESFFPHSDDDLKKTVDRILQILKAQYTLAYYPPDPGRFRRIEVRVRRRGVRLLTRRGAGGSETDAPVHFKASSCEVSPTEHPYPWESRVVDTAAGARLYHEDFSDPATGWPSRHEQKKMQESPGQISRSRGFPPSALPVLASYQAGVRYVPGGYEVSRKLAPHSVSAGPLTEGTVVAYGPSWDDFRASLIVQADWKSTVTGIVFGLSESGYCALLVSGTTLPRGEHNREIAYEIVKKTLPEATVSTLIPWTAVPASGDRSLTPATETSIHKLTVERRRGEVTVSVDDQRVSPSNIAESSLDHGLIGFGLFGDGRAVFHDLLIQSLP